MGGTSAARMRGRGVWGAGCVPACLCVCVWLEARCGPPRRHGRSLFYHQIHVFLSPHSHPPPSQVELMAGTGILIAPHGAHLANAMFLPAHAAVIELFPYMMKKNTYRHLSLMSDLHYLPFYSWELLGPEHNKTVYGVALMQVRGGGGCCTVVVGLGGWWV